MSNALKIDSTIKPTNGIQHQFLSKTDSNIKPETGFNVNSILRHIQELNP